MTRAGEREVVKAEHVNGGAGYILKEAPPENRKIF